MEAGSAETMEHCWVSCSVDEMVAVSDSETDAPKVDPMVPP